MSEVRRTTKAVKVSIPADLLRAVAEHGSYGDPLRSF
jgi:hypothetical protein